MSAHTRNLPGESECRGGLVQTKDRSHVCLDCNGDGCKPKRVRHYVRARRQKLYESLSGCVVMSDQKGRAVFVDLERGTAHVMEDAS